MLWTEKYRPRRLVELVGQEQFKMDAENWVLLKDMPNILIYGSAGTGKTTAAYVLGYEILGDNMRSNFYEINASDDRKLETVRTKIKDIVSHATSGDVPFKIIFLDEMEGMTTDAQEIAYNHAAKMLSNNIKY